MATPGSGGLRTPAVLWTTAGLTPLLAVGEHGLTPGTATCVSAWVAGWIALWARSRRPREPLALAGPWDSAAVRAAALVVLALLQVVAVLGSGLALAVTGMLLSSAALLLWSLAPTAAALRTAVCRALLVLVSTATAAAMAELVCRTDAVVERTGGSVANRRRVVAERYDRQWTTNRHGLRSFHADEPKPEGWLRVLTLGDSFTWGDQIADTAATWPYVMERALQGRGLPAQVLNLAEPGFTTVNSVERLEQIGWAMQPDAVVLQFGLNDPLPSRPGGRSVSEEWLFPIWHLPPEMAIVRQHSYLWALLDDRVTAVQMRRRHPRGYAPLYDDAFPGWRACTAALDAVGAAATARGVPVLLVLFPPLNVRLDEGAYPYLELHEKIRGAAVTASLLVVDLRPVLAAVDPDPARWRASPWDAHPGPAAHSLAGTAVASQLLRMAGPDTSTGP